MPIPSNDDENEGKKMSKLYELPEAFAALEKALETAEADPELVDVRPVILAELEKLNLEESEKMRGIAGLIKSYQGDAEACRKEAKRLQAKTKAIEGYIDQLREYAKSYMVRMDKPSIKAGVFTWSLGSSQSVLLKVPVEELPDEYKRVKTETEADKVAIGKALKEGKDLDFAQFQINTTVTLK